MDFPILIEYNTYMMCMVNMGGHDMKHRLVLFLLEALCMVMLAGCGQNAEGNKEVSPEEQTILNAKTLWEDNENLYEVPLAMLDGVEKAQVYRFGDDLLLTYDTYDEEKGKSVYVIKLVSLETGELLYEQQLESLTFATVQVLDEHIAINDLGDAKCYLLDSKLELLNTYDLPGGMFCLDKKGKNAYQFTYDQGIKVIDLDTGKFDVLLENGANVYLCEASGNEATFVYTDRDTLFRSSGVLDLNSGEIRAVESPYAFNELEASGSIWLGDVEGVTPFYVLSDGTEQGIFYGDISATVGINNASGHMVICNTIGAGDHFLLVYDNQGNLLSSCDVNGLSLYEMMDFAWFEEYNGYVFSLSDEANQAHLMFWEIAGEIVEDDLGLEDVMESVKAPVGTAVRKELFDRAENLSEKYGVEILIADQCDTVFTDHRADLLLEEADIEQALDTVDYVLSRYPEGFFEQLKHNAYKEIEIQLVGILEKDYSEGDITYVSGGFVNHSYMGKLLMALDARPMNLDDEINPILEGTMYHEFSHIIDKRLEYDSIYREDASYSENGWLNLNPDGFEYNDSYYGTLDPQYADYFVDHYACTNSTEDRARIMESAMQNDVSVFEGKEGLTEKLRYYSEGIRDSFDITGWPKILPWEAPLYSMN